MNEFIRDTESKAIINTNTKEIHARRQYKQLKARIVVLEQEIAALKTQIQTLISSRG